MGCTGLGGETLAVGAVGLQEPLCPSEKDSPGEMGEFCALTTALVKNFPEEKQGGILPSWEATMLSARLLQQTVLIYSPWLQAGRELQTQA